MYKNIRVKTILTCCKVGKNISAINFAVLMIRAYYFSYNFAAFNLKFSLLKVDTTNRKTFTTVKISYSTVYTGFQPFDSNSWFLKVFSAKFQVFSRF